ncbi:hypothetical protein [Herbaspirillum sp. YR522]|uniref:hypothetical protein n=1 Tax=Herbaspirillum sp. YR522 TaxID=1144342 RepID=UPI0012F9F7B9|nr:hypothetical protein [Herbaspirillum sp. YR522]
MPASPPPRTFGHRHAATPRAARAGDFCPALMAPDNNSAGTTTLLAKIGYDCFCTRRNILARFKNNLNRRATTPRRLSNSGSVWPTPGNMVSDHGAI